MKTLYIVDDHKMMQKGVKDYLEENTDWRVPKTFSQSQECLKALKDAGGRNELPQIVIVDVQLLNESGLELAQTIARDFPSVQCVMYSMYDTTGFVLQARDSGASGYISKVAKEEELAHCLEVVQNGGTYLEQYMLDAQNKIDSIVSILSKQERNIFEALLQEKTNKQICDELYISSRTVENYTSRLYSKIGVKNREELIEKFK